MSDAGADDRDVVRAGIAQRLERLGVEPIDLLQFHWWMFEHPGYLDAMQELVALQQEGRIRHLGVTNFDTDHLRVLVKHGIPIVSNQVSFSLLDRRAAEDMSAFCLAAGVRLLAYGTLAGGFLTDRWVGAPEPTSIADWSKTKYKRFIDTIGGWSALQAILAALHEVARRHGVSVANVATRWVLEQPAVAAVDRRRPARRARASGRQRRPVLVRARRRGQGADRRGPGCDAPHPGRLRRRVSPPALPYRLGRPQPSPRAAFRRSIGRSRSRAGRTACASTPAASGSRSAATAAPCGLATASWSAAPRRPTARAKSSARAMPHGQAVYILDKIAASIASLGGTLADVVRTRIYLRNADDWEAVSRVHGRYFGAMRPANTLLEVSRLVGEYAVEIEAEAVVS